jgi:uncharacterized membrane protein YjfL (UPF0719 family)
MFSLNSTKVILRRLNIWAANGLGVDILAMFLFHLLTPQHEKNEIERGKFYFASIHVIEINIPVGAGR